MFGRADPIPLFELYYHLMSYEMRLEAYNEDGQYSSSTNSASHGGFRGRGGRSRGRNSGGRGPQGRGGTNGARQPKQGGPSDEPHPAGHGRRAEGGRRLLVQRGHRPAPRRGRPGRHRLRRQRQGLL